MDHKTLTITPIVVSLAVILLLGANIGLIASVSGKQPADPTNFGPNCVGCITTQNVANGAITHAKIAPHSVDQTQLTFAIHNGAQGPQGPQGPAGPAGPIGQTGATGPAGPSTTLDTLGIHLIKIPAGQDGWTPGHSGEQTVTFGPNSGNGVGGPDLSMINYNSTVLVHVTGGDTSGMVCSVYDTFDTPGETYGFDMYCDGAAPNTGDPGATLNVVVFNPH